MTEDLPAYRFFVVQDDGFDAGRIIDGPFASVPRAIKAKNRYEKDSVVNFRIDENPEHPDAMRGEGDVGDVDE